MENQERNENQGLLDALESLSAALSVVSSSVDMVREELQCVLSALYIQPPPSAAVPIVEEPPAKTEHAPAIYLVDSSPVKRIVADEPVETSLRAYVSPSA